jgi:O-antigen ligase
MITVILIISIYFLSSRAGILTAIITLPVYLFLKFRTMGKLRYFGVSVLLMTFIFVPVVLTNPRVNNYHDWREKHRNPSSAVSNDRMIILNSVRTMLGQNLILGTGTGDIQDELNEEFRSTGNMKLAEVNTNTHNQFLEILIEHGLIGLIIFLSMILMMFYIAYKRRNTLYLMFLLLVSISFLFETMLNRLAGVTFFSLFSFLLIVECQNRITLSGEK